MFIDRAFLKILHPFRGAMYGTVYMSLLRSEEGLLNRLVYKHVTLPE
jgi:hypothetical protein